MSTVVTDPAVIGVLQRKGLDPESVELAEDYCVRHPRAKFYRSKRGDLQLGVFRSRRRVRADGKRIALAWLPTEKGFVAAANTIAVMVMGETVTVGAGSKSVT